MPNFEYEVNSHVKAAINTDKGSLMFTTINNHEEPVELSEEECEKVKRYYKHNFSKNNKITLLLSGDDEAPYDFEAIEIQLGCLVNVEKNNLLDVHVKNDMTVLAYLLKKRSFGLRVKLGSVYFSLEHPMDKHQLEIIKSCGFRHLCVVTKLSDLKDVSVMNKVIDHIDMLSREGFYVRLIININEKDLVDLKEVYCELFRKGAFRTVINDILLNCVYADYHYETQPLDLLIKSNIVCYEKLCSQLVTNPEMLGMKIIGDKFVNRMQSVIDYRVPLKPIEAYELGDQIQVSINNTSCTGSVFFGGYEKCERCEKYTLCGGLLDRDQCRCIDIESFMKSAYGIYSFVSGGIV